MKKIKAFILSLIMLSFASVSFAQDYTSPLSKENKTKKMEDEKMEKIKEELRNTLYLKLKDGIVVIKMLPNVAPEHVERIKILTRSGFYDGVVFHRVIEDFMAQTGDPTGTGTGGSEWPDLYAEFNDSPHVRGAVSMARAMDPDSANSQFFIVTKDSTFLDGQYTVWGIVTEGMEYVDNIKLGNPANNGMVTDPDKMEWMKIAYDVEEKNTDPKMSALDKLKLGFQEKIENIEVPTGLEVLGVEPKKE
jgi:peptidylprolyl isomerase